MKKETKPTIDPLIEFDCSEILRIRRITSAQGNDIDVIYNLYKKYIDSDAQYPIKSCTSCPKSVGAYYWKVISLPSNYNDLIKLKK